MTKQNPTRSETAMFESLSGTFGSRRTRETFSVLGLPTPAVKRPAKCGVADEFGQPCTLPTGHAAMPKYAQSAGMHKSSEGWFDA